MLRTHAAFFSMLRSVVDIVIIGICWVVVYFVRFYSGIFSVERGIPGFNRHLLLTVPVILICFIACLWSGLYKPQRVQHMFQLFSDTLKASILSGLFVFTFLYSTLGTRYSIMGDAPYTRILTILFVPTLFLGLSFSHLFTMSFLRKLRKKGYNLRHYAVIGAGKKGRQLVSDISKMGWLGLKCAFFVDEDANNSGREMFGCPVYSPIEKTLELVKENRIDEVYLALSGSEAQRAYPILESLQSAGVTVRIIPDWGNLLSMSNPVVVPIGSQVLFSAGDSPLSGCNIILKHIFDFIAAFIIIVILSIPMLFIALLVKISSRGPVFYKQGRVGMDQKEFKIYKFRTMRDNAEEESGPAWSTKDDVRRTKIGVFLRRTSLDELPQLFNVLMGQMSLVGPRPERPNFVKEFSEEYKKYMLRHKVRAGMTGWAQINGFRGDTSLRKRLVYDLYYVRNWSFALDLWILLRTPWHVIKGENAH
ncbi:MAG: undecaprenyl-phosphate glucose phosphotransferase [Sedimentisphaerales bacterium]|nr:undecaprenyl-phosphate glucose phosphotransferase [Sedimentisphaerales bacterium]